MGQSENAGESLGKVLNQNQIQNKIQNKKQKVKTRRGLSKREIKKRNKSMTFSILGTNANGLRGKSDSFLNTVKVFQPSCITVQETKLRSKVYKIPGYQVFLKNRPGMGGGLLTAVDENLAPVLVSSPDTEILVVQTKVGENEIRIINGYGPQEEDNVQSIHNFWQDIEKEIISAKEQNCKILLQFDANAKIGNEFLALDPNKMSNNGKIMLDILKRQNLFILNIDKNCKGVITRQRVTVKGVEISVLDYTIVCENLKMMFDHMMIDEDRTHVLTKYTKKRGLSIKTESDHNITFAKFNIQYR